jgi:hypothetical protein
MPSTPAAKSPHVPGDGAAPDDAVIGMPFPSSVARVAIKGTGLLIGPSMPEWLRVRPDFLEPATNPSPLPPEFHCWVHRLPHAPKKNCPPCAFAWSAPVLKLNANGFCVLALSFTPMEVPFRNPSK